jgi:outer membrane protein TolC
LARAAIAHMCSERTALSYWCALPVLAAPFSSVVPHGSPLDFDGGVMCKIPFGSRALLAPLLIFQLAAPGFASEAPLTLTGAVKQALEKNPEIQQLRHRLRAMEAKAKQAPYLEDPQIAFQLGGVPLSNPTSLNQADTNSIGIRQMIPFFGKLGLKEKIAQRETNIAAQELRAKEREIATMVKMAYADLFMAERSIEILRDQLEILRVVIGATEARYRVGQVAQQDVFKAQLEQSQVLNQLIAAEGEVTVATVKLNTVMYQPPRTAVRSAADLTLPPRAPNTSTLDDLALANRPELQGAEREIERAEIMYELADRNRKYPDFMIGWDYMRMPMEMKKDRYGAMINITIPFSPWTAGRRNYEVEESLAEIRAARASREAMRNMTVKQVGESEARVQATRRTLQLYREGLLSQAELSFRSALSAYQTGRVEFVSLLEAQRALREARMGYYKTTANLLQSLADLERAVGQDLE